MCDGSLKAVEEVEEGEYVLARDERTGEVGCKLVVGPYHNLEEAILLLSLQDETGKVERIETTANHPFFVQGRGWQRVDALELGDQVPSATGPPAHSGGAGMDSESGDGVQLWRRRLPLLLCGGSRRLGSQRLRFQLGPYPKRTQRRRQ